MSIHTHALEHTHEHCIVSNFSPGADGYKVMMRCQQQLFCENYSGKKTVIAGLKQESSAMASGLHLFYPYFFTFTKNKTVITGLKEDSSAMASGLQPGDVLTMVDGFDVLQHPAAQVSPLPYLPLFTNERLENKNKNKQAK